jgi:hypothetical protein
MARAGRKPSIDEAKVREARRIYAAIRSEGRPVRWKILARQLGVRSCQALRYATTGRTYGWVE